MCSLFGHFLCSKKEVCTNKDIWLEKFLAEVVAVASNLKHLGLGLE